MARISVPFSGITSHPNHKDGECSNIVNLRPKNGYLKPVPPRAEHAQLNREYDIVFVHKVGTSEKWIGVAGSTIYTGINTASPQTLERVDGSINSVQQIGNTLSFVTNTTIYYVLWQNEEYKFLGEIPELPVVNFSTPSMETMNLSYTSEFGVTPSTDIEKKEELVDYTVSLAKTLIDRRPYKFHDAFFISYALRLYDGSAINHSTPILVMPQDEFKTWGYAYLPYDINNTEYGTDSEVRLKMFNLTAAYDFTALEDWKDVIKSVDFFTTKYIGLASPDNINKHFINRMVSDGRGTPKTYLHNIYYSNARREEESFADTPEDKALNTSQFYLYYSEDDFSSKTTEFPNNKVTVRDNYYNIIHQEDMPSSSFSHHRIGAKNATVYNNRLRLSGLTTSLYLGHPLPQFRWRSNYNGVDTSEGFVTSGSIMVYVTLQTEQGEFVVARNTDNQLVLFNNAFISYPDPRATRIRVFSVESNGYIHQRLDVKLSPHPRLNIAYAINPDLKPFVSDVDTVVYGTPHYNFNARLIEPNKLKVSEVNNPFYFPSKNTYQIGSGTILAESSIVMNVTDRNYGMYPVFVFTDNGVFTMAGQTSDSVHDSVQAPTYLEPPISDKICATPYGVVFITKRGLMIISQHETKFLSPQLRDDGDNVIFRMPGTNDDPVVDLHDKISPADSITFREFLSTVSDMIYNPYNDELIISSKENEYCYVYDFPTSSYYISTENITGIVQNSFPDIYVLDGKNVKDYSQKHNGTTNISIITRPLHFGTSDIKTLERTILRALLYKVHSITVIAFHSVDGVRFEPAKGRLVMGDDKNYKDIDLGLLARETYPHYVLLISGTIDDESQIRYAEFEIVKRYDNDKMR